MVGAGQASAQQPAPVASAAPDSVKLEIDTSYLDNNIHGFGKAEILGSDGKTHFVWVPIEPLGFSKYLPFYRNEAEARRFHRAPSSIDVDKVVSVKLNGLYQEHIVLKGKRKHLLATRLVNGPVELFNYTEAPQPVVGPPGVVGPSAWSITGLSGLPDRQWFLRRTGQGLVKVERMSFATQMATYFQDDPEVVAALNSGKLNYRDMVKLVQGYNEFRTRPAAR
ncbi:hypothetical protein BEN48_03290 [Hymenobacter glacialis]|uniref:Uncharacterized protein n=1 Tax=Hymenobacter glacialis TaxID=1908236 RepID=A0A1G1SYU9_9BACT|nr:hypothetical protein BEN48_03290 [Hymenobacter glacialis]